MLKRFLLVCVLLCLPASLFAGEPVLVDTRLLVLAHPLFSQFDTNTGRFRNTPSEYVDGGQSGVDALVAEIQKLDAWLLRSPQILRERLKDVPLPDRMAIERNFLNEKREKEKGLAAMKMRAYMARLVPGRPGVTPDSSIYPQINQIMTDVRAVIKTVKERHRSDLVIDACDFLPVVDSSGIRPELLVQNLHFSLWKGKPADEHFLAWFAAADQFWAGQLGMDAQIFPAGVTDVRLEALKLLEERTKGQQK
ncbi:MAG TPA: hypothetical protein DCG57_18290 [Candidatus Riflebacteria bacterium]|jgi:uncharacterized protein (DUF3820 family)|nr:hypothetical protein [Candidatus Riflebacteria bacterium]